MQIRSVWHVQAQRAFLRPANDEGADRAGAAVPAPCRQSTDRRYTARVTPGYNGRKSYARALGLHYRCRGGRAGGPRCAASVMAALDSRSGTAARLITLRSLTYLERGG